MHEAHRDVMSQSITGYEKCSQFAVWMLKKYGNTCLDIPLQSIYRPCLFLKN